MQTEIKENDLINKTALTLCDGQLDSLKFYGSTEEPLVEITALLKVLTDVSRDDLMALLAKDDHITYNNTIYLKDSGWYTALYMTKLEVGQYFRRFIKNLLRKLWETNPTLLIETAEQTKRELAQLRIKYRQQQHENHESQERIRELSFSIEAQDKRSTKIIGMLKNARAPDPADNTNEFELMCQKFLKPIYVFMVPPPKKGADSDDDDEDYTIYSVDVEPDPDTAHYYSVSVSAKKADSTLVKVMYGPPKLETIKKQLESYKINALVYRCSLNVISEIVDKERLVHIQSKKTKKTKEPKESKNASDSD